ncbi:hypothetical protein BaRGS_00031889 [Batillaria attramentaria]|uniref:Uncharacterized protein n=1 Tax=Batillaria attramentaria TaxID=370345 RepID=A0ABD0JPD5_9CAEN
MVCIMYLEIHFKSRLPLGIKTAHALLFPVLNTSSSRCFVSGAGDAAGPTLHAPPREMSTSTPAACIEFSQNAWRPGLCANCQRPRTEHPAANSTSTTTPVTTGSLHRRQQLEKSVSTPSPVPNKRSFTVLKQQSVPTLKQKNSSETTHANKDSEGQKKKQSVTVVGGGLGDPTDGTNSDENKVITTTGRGVTKIAIGSDKYKDEKEIDSSSQSTAPTQLKSILSQKKCKVVIVDRPGEHQNSRVVFIDGSPDIIGYDGGIANLFLEDDDLEQSPTPSGEETFSFTDEEKYFALLALENTVWNSDAQNLLQEETTAASAHRRTSKEFEDLNLDTLCFQKRFQNLKDCDATKRFGTFPLSKKPSSSKLTVENVFPASNPSGSTDFDASRLTGNLSDKGGESESSGSEHYKPSVSRVDQLRSSSLSGDSSLTSLSSDGEAKSVPGMSESSTPAYKVVDIVDQSRRESYTVRDITSCLYEPTDSQPKRDGDSASENSGNSSGKGHPSSSENSGGSPTNVKVKTRVRPVGMRVSTIERNSSPHRELTGDGSEADSDPFNDSTTAAGLQVLALLNDVLDNYGENESSTDDVEDQRRSGDKRETDKGGKKSADFEARMASVAANLDLSKQQRAKRPAPRPPNSPPPEPTVSPKKKTQNQPEPVFKMVPMGKAIMAIPPTQDIPKSSQGSGQGQGLPSFDDLPESAENGDRDGNRTKKGITSFFRNILRRGKDSSESFESSNPEIQFVRQDSRPENVSASAPVLTDTSTAQSTVEKKASDTSPQSKFRVLPQGAAAGVKVAQGPGNAALSRKKSSADSENSGESPTSASQPKSSSPTLQPKSKGLASPKEMLRRTAAKLSPPTQRKSVSSSKEETTAPATKPKPALAAKKSDEREGSEAGSAPNPVRRRAKSPKRIPPPAPPARPVVPAKTDDGRSTDLARELEQRLKSSASVGVAAPAKPATQPKPEVQPYSSRSETRKSMTVPPPSPPTAGKTPTHVSRSPPSSPTPEESDSQPGSPTATNPPDGRLDETTSSDDSPRFVEKIELPTAMPGKKGFLGKLNMNRKSRAPAPPSVKRARSISDAEKRGKKINPADISGPVLVTDITNTAILENRRNTISLGDDPAFSAAASSAAAQSIEKGFDDLDMPILSPLGSLENLYEAILPKEGPGGKFPYYDPPGTTSRALCPNIPAEGYLEPLPTTTAATADTSEQNSEAVTSSDAVDAGSSELNEDEFESGGSGGGGSGDVFVESVATVAAESGVVSKVSNAMASSRFFAVTKCLQVWL